MGGARRERMRGGGRIVTKYEKADGGYFDSIGDPK